MVTFLSAPRPLQSRAQRPCRIPRGFTSSSGVANVTAGWTSAASR